MNFVERRANDVEIQQLKRRVSKVEKGQTDQDQRIDDIEQDVSVLHSRECPRLVTKKKAAKFFKEWRIVFFIFGLLALTIIFGKETVAELIRAFH